MREFEDRGVVDPSANDPGMAAAARQVHGRRGKAEQAGELSCELLRQSSPETLPTAS
jgi:hypothetical protein